MISRMAFNADIKDMPIKRVSRLTNKVSAPISKIPDHTLLISLTHECPDVRCHCPLRHLCQAQTLGLFPFCSLWPSADLQGAGLDEHLPSLSRSNHIQVITVHSAHWSIVIELQESIRGCDVFLIQPTCPPVNDSLMELLVMIDACRRASARSITAVIPYFGYARADRKSQGRESIAAKLVANMITEAGESFTAPGFKHSSCCRVALSMLCAGVLLVCHDLCMCWRAFRMTVGHAIDCQSVLQCDLCHLKRISLSSNALMLQSASCMLV